MMGVSKPELLMGKRIIRITWHVEGYAILTDCTIFSKLTTESARAEAHSILPFPILI